MKTSRDKEEGFLWTLPRDSWRLAAAFGTTSVVLIAVVMHIFGWFTDNGYWMKKGLEGVGYAFGYFIVVVLLKFLYEIFKEERTEEIDLNKLMEGVKIKTKEKR